jgi:3-oxoadipate enol-lactonase
VTPALDTLVTGHGAPVTVAAHGLGASIAETRPLLGGVPGSKVFYAARGHGGSPLPDQPVDGAVLAADLEAVADAHGAEQALGVSLGAGALLSLLAQRPDRFTRVVLFLPAALDRPREAQAVRRLSALAAALDGGDAEAVQDWVRAEVPPELQALPAAQAYLFSRSAQLLAWPGIAPLLRTLPASPPVADRELLAAVTAPVLVLASEGDPLHPASVARDVAAALPRAELVVFDQPGVVFRERARLRGLIADFLS